ncbi:hypothetical protein HG772_000233 [Salmonella enterica]|nr:hypothetical protein [Salmonella enterica]ECZ5385825.1 hypothetical protein [Salmonella enterica subsp. enterica serovar Montevideo]ECF6666799.1 hypothetical protein [Salmonella enterica]EFS0969303.1 hypothetical protein [Salmonella enterica]EGG9433599.1 hypothetical protein [Salmonella enterica]
MKRKNASITGDRVMKIERVAVDVTAKTGSVTKWTDVINYLIDNYLQDAKQDMLHTHESDSKKE